VESICFFVSANSIFWKTLLRSSDSNSTPKLISSLDNLPIASTPTFSKTEFKLEITLLRDFVTRLLTAFSHFSKFCIIPLPNAAPIFLPQSKNNTAALSNTLPNCPNTSCTTRIIVTNQPAALSTKKSIAIPAF